MEFKQRYTALNARQKEAVDTIDGPVMVVAGPGTGKTELLSVRVANILAKTDTLPSSVLCLTFTDSAANNMRERLIGLMGADAYKVTIHTFHSFGSEIMNRYSQFFYHGAHFRPADELTTHEILNELLQKLPHDNALASTMNGEFTYLRDIQRTISDMKRSGYTPDELTGILDRNDAFSSWVQPHLIDIFTPTMSKKLFDPIESLLTDMQTYDEESTELIGYHSLKDHIIASLETALNEAREQNSTKPLSAWKKDYIYKNNEGDPALKDEKTSQKIRATIQLYYEYLIAMQERSLYDYDDMILRVVHAMEVFNELRFELQEHYQYIMVDEFQDTNEAQMRMLWNLTNNPSQDLSPNILVVGDDDQAIYRFQGADMSNILDFTSRYEGVKIITLADNYRSAAPVLDAARHVVSHISERLETSLDNIDKTLTPHYEIAKPTVAVSRYTTDIDARHQLASYLREAYQTSSSKTRAVIARNHRQLLSLVPHLEQLDIPLQYELQENALESEPVQQLELLARIVHHLSRGEYDDSQALMPELLSHPAWAIAPIELWQLSIDARKNHQFWLEGMLELEGRLQQIAEWLIVTAHMSQTSSLETMLDRLFGVTDEQSADSAHHDEHDEEGEVQEEFVSPFRAYFFPSESLETMPTQYVVWLHTLQQLRSRIRDYRMNTSLRLRDFIHFIDMHKAAGLRMQASTHIEHAESAVTLLTAHKSKGLEFDEVYILDASEHVWGDGARTRPKLIQFPSNMPLSPAGDSHDERLRLLFVAMTRARQSLLFITSHEQENGKTSLPVAVLSDEQFAVTEYEPAPHQAIEALRADWKPRILDVALSTKEQILRPLLRQYKLSATHLNNFLNVPGGGPELFLLHNLLRFPQAMSPSAIYGSAIHESLQRTHTHLSATGNKRPIEDVLNDFESILADSQLTETERALYVGRGTSALTAFLTKSYETFSPSQLVERSFGREDIRVGEARITGAIDLIDIDDKEKTIFITDYKTGKPAHSWRGTTDYEKIKLHHYEQQLMLYKLLIEGSDQFRGYTVTGSRISFVEPDQKNDIVALDYVYDSEKLAEFTRLIEVVWKQIQDLRFELTEEYDPSIKGILSFEQDLLQK